MPAHLEPTVLPNEILFTIIASVLGESLHLICISDAERPWDIIAPQILSSVSWKFRDVTMDILAKTFELPIDNELIPKVSSKFKVLRDNALRATSAASVSEINHQSESPICSLYSVFLAVRHFWRVASTESLEVFKVIKDAVRVAFGVYRKLCEQIKPTEMSVFILCAFEDLENLYGYGSLVVMSCVQLLRSASLYGRLQDRTDEEAVGLRKDLHDAMTDVLHSVEVGSIQYTKISALKNSHGLYSEVPVYKLSGVLNTIQKLHAANLQDEEFGINSRCGTLLERWEDAASGTSDIALFRRERVEISTETPP